MFSFLFPFRNGNTMWQDLMLSNAETRRLTHAAALESRMAVQATVKERRNAEAALKEKNELLAKEKERKTHERTAEQDEALLTVFEQEQLEEQKKEREIQRICEVYKKEKKDSNAQNSIEILLCTIVYKLDKR